MGGVLKKQTRRRGLKPPKASQEKLLDAVASQAASTELLRSRKEQSPVREGLSRDSEPVQSTKRRLKATESDPLPAKRARSTRTDAQPREVVDEQAEQVDETILQQPARPCSSPLEPKVEGPEQITPATPLRKRRIDSDSNDEEYQLSRARLTRQNLALFNRMAKNKGEKALMSGPSDSTIESSTTKTTSTTSSGFAIQATKNGILPPAKSKPPENIEDLRERLARSRGTASPSESAYKHYVNKTDHAINEATMVFEVGRKLLKEYRDDDGNDDGYEKMFNQAFTGFPKEVGFNNGLSAPQPDFVEGLRMEEFLPFPVDDHVSGAVLVKDDPYSVTLPHLAGEWKGRGKDMEEARLQSAYVGAALVHSRNQALAHIGKPDPPGHAEVATFTTDGTNINFFAHYSAPSEDGMLKYHQYPISSTNLKNSHQEHKQGRRALRNDQDHARKQSYALRDQLKEHWKQRAGGLRPIAEGAPPPVEPRDTTNAYYEDEVEGGYEIIEQPHQPTPPASSKPEHKSIHGKASSSHSSSSKSVSSANSYDSRNSAQKRKASLSQGSSHGSSKQKGKSRNYWERDAESGRYFHQHSDGRVTWADDDGH
ncbi:hypothetical protein F4779DRAFT_173757 [Xylariaceae sp. FL0662B]|nr:hypothetical protein F4779DRAFT_173757 [Xylariaceae sp. FL0662B]